MRSLTFAAALVLAACATPSSTTTTPLSTVGVAPSWSAEQADAVLARTQRLHLAPDLSQLTPGEQIALRELIAAGQRMHTLYLAQKHPQGAAAEAYLAAHPELTRERDLMRLSS